MNKLSIRSALRKKKKGFTLVELIIVIAIIAILAAMAIPKFSAVRIDAKVSNDVAAAKNIQTQIATLIANSDTAIKVPTEAVTDVPKVVLDRLDGKASNGTAEALKDKKFKYTVNKSEDITICVDVAANELYPDKEGNGKKAYITAIAAQNKVE